jgi:deoxyribodipyrimidine photo-lyase
MPVLTTLGIVLAECRRNWDSAIGRHSTAGFFKVKQQMPRILDELELQ